MLRVLLLDCSESLKDKLERQGFPVEAGTMGFSTGHRKLPSQVYEHDVFFYNPEKSPTTSGPDDLSPEYDVRHIAARIESGGTLVVFLNKVAGNIDHERLIYSWIPYMPPLQLTSDKIVFENTFERYPDSKAEHLAPIVTTDHLSHPVLIKLTPPNSAPVYPDIFEFLWNRNGDCLGVQIRRGRGSLILLPKFESNEEVIETFLHRVAPKIYGLKLHNTLTDAFDSPTEISMNAELSELELIEKEIEGKQEHARVRLAAAIRQKKNTIENDAVSKQILVYHEHALREDDASLFYLYKIVEHITNKFGGEREAIKVLGVETELKAVKRLANESYRDARHAPKPGDVVKKWTHAEIEKCFKDTEKVVAAYFSTLFPPPAKAEHPINPPPD